MTAIALVMMLKIAFLNLMVMQSVSPSLSLDNQLVVLRTWQASPLQFFEQMVAKEMLKIVEQTNLYAQQTWKTPLSPHIPEHDGTIDIAELKKFLAITITMGLISYPWSTSWPYAISAISKVCVYITLLFLVQLLSLKHLFIQYHKK